MPGSRKADYYLGCNDGSVFIDFSKRPNGRIKLVRISFDGHGCYGVSEEVSEMTAADSALFIHMLKEKKVNQNEMNRILYNYFNDNRRLMQYDAMVEYGLYEG
jgi:hypothetical protein